MSLLDFLFPRRSLGGHEGAWITPAERARLLSHPRHFEAPELRRLGMPSLDAVFAVSTFRDCPFLREAIHRWKYGRLPGVGEILAEEFLTSCGKHLKFRRDACVCPVPLHWTRQFFRGFNQADVLARALARESGLPHRRLLRRTRPTGHQAWRERGERLRAVRGAFAVGHGQGHGGDPCPCPFPCPPFTVYLVDDLTTTGATLEACAKVLKDAGVRRVEGVVLAHG